MLQLAVALRLRTGELVGLVLHPGQPLLLQLAQFLVGLVDGVEQGQHFRLQLGFHRREGEVCTFILVIVVVVVVGFLVVAAVGSRRRAVGTQGVGTIGCIGLRAAIGRIVLARAAAMGGVQINDVAQQNLFLLKRVTPGNDGPDGQRRFTDRTDHLFAAGLDPLRDGDLAFTRQQLDRAHFTQIHANGIIRPAQILGARPAGLGRRHGDLCPGYLGCVRRFVVRCRLGAGVVLFFFLDDVDAHFRKLREDILDLLGRHLFLWQGFVQFVIGDESAFLTARNHLLDALNRAIHQRTVGRVFTLFGVFFLGFVSCHIFPRSGGG